MKMKIPVSEHLHVIRLVLLAFPLMAVNTPLHAEVQPVKSEASTTNVVQVVTENADLNQVSDYEKLAERLDKVSEKAESYYEKRYEELKATHAWFMGAVGICLAVFTLLGVLLPFAVAILQHRNFDNAIGVAKEKFGLEFGSRIEGVLQETRMRNITALSITISQAIMMVDAQPIKSKAEQFQCEIGLSVIIQTLHLIFESAMQTKRAQVIISEIEKYRDFISRWKEGEPPLRHEVWRKAEDMMKSSVSRDASAVTRKDYAELLGEHSEAFLWLKNFYEQIAPWKFEEEK